MKIGIDVGGGMLHPNKKIVEIGRKVIKVDEGEQYSGLKNCLAIPLYL